MPKLKTVYVCQNCAYEASNWIGQCPSCHEWNTFIEDIKSVATTRTKMGPSKSSLVPSKPINLQGVKITNIKRLSSGIGEFDRVLGGGFVPGQVILLGGEPGVGKSTILTEIGKHIATQKLLYVCGEENVDQIKLRAERMGYKNANLFLLQETDVTSITSVLETESNVDLVIIDSVQTLIHPDLAGVAGSITQVRGCAQMLTNTAKALKIPVILVGHVTKEGVVAGPKVLEHIVDTVLYLEGDSQHMYRLLRTAKNRFGPVSEVGIFEMSEDGMREVANPSELSLSHLSEAASGTCVTVVMEGFRPILFEVQALTAKTAFGYPKRTTSGYNVNRLQVLIALLEKRCGLNLSNYDVYLNIAGGFKVSEYAADLAVCIAVASSIKDKPVKPKVAVFGECGLNGEVRKVSHQDKRVKEAKKLGFSTVISQDTTKTIMEALKRAIM